MKHAVFAPSGAPRWANCTSSFYLHQQEEEKLVNDSPSIYAREGTILHDICAQHLQDGVPFSSHLGYREPYGDEEIHIDEDAIYACQSYVDIIQSYIVDNPGAIQYVETRVKIEEDSWGTADFMLNAEQHHHLHVFDAKFGRGEEVMVEENEQLMSYGIGALNELDPMERFPKWITLHIVQPRLPVGDIHKQWTVNVTEFYRLFERVKKARETILQGFEFTKFNPGEKQCRWCNYGGDCKALAEFNLAKASVHFGDFSDLTPDSVKAATAESLKLSLDDKVRFKRIFPILTEWMKKIEQELLDEAMRKLHKGKRIPGYIVTESIKHRQWKDKEAMESILVKNLGDEAYAPRKIITPAQAEKKLPQHKEKLQKYITKPKGSPVLSSDHTNKPEYKLDAQEVFAAYKES